MKKLVTVLVSSILIISTQSCKKNVSTMPEEKVDTVAVVDTTPVVKEETWDSVDTTDNATFEERDLEAEFAAKVKENLQTIYFDYNSYALTPEAQEKLIKAAKFLLSDKNFRIKVEGNTDERGSTGYNLSLGEKRAKVVKDFLVKYGVNPKRIEITSYGKENLVEFGCADEACHAKNRRDEFVVIK